MWYDSSVFYQIYPLGFCGDAGIGKIAGWIPHIKRLGANALYLSPVFESDNHGYDTRDYRLIDRRLGTNDDFKALVHLLHENGIRVVIDAVFNHVGRGFRAFRDVQEKKWDSPYRGWFNLSFDGNSPYNDGFWYEGWEGHYELVKLNLRNPEVVSYLLDTVRFWVSEFDVDGLRLDVAYCLDLDFLRRLRELANVIKPGFFLLGETLHGDYNRWMNDSMLHSVTNYECYKGLWSGLNSMNLFEIVHSLKRQFGPEYWTLYKGRHLLCFADNHDVSRAASILTNKDHLVPMYGLLFGMPGIPCVYYGSEWGEEATKQPGGDWNLRPSFAEPVWNGLTDAIAKMAAAHRDSEALCFGSFRDLVLTNRQTVFARETERERVLVCVNADSAPFFARFGAGSSAVDLLTGEALEISGGVELRPYEVKYLRVTA